MNRQTAFAALSLAAVPLAGCATAEGDYPSLAIRDVERAEGQFEPVDTPTLDVPEVATTGVDGPAAPLASARASHARFLAALPGARRAVSAGRGAAAGSNAWGAAQVALADLESIRSDTAIALADFDTLHLSADVQASLTQPLIDGRAEIIRLVSEEDAALADLRR